MTNPDPIENLPGTDAIADPDTGQGALRSGERDGDLIADFWIVRQLQVVDDERLWTQVLYATSREKALAKLKPVLMGLGLRQRDEGERTYLSKDDTNIFVVYRQVLRTGWMNGTPLERRRAQEDMILLKTD